MLKLIQVTWFLEDGSSNGTYLNQVKLPKMSRQPLAEGDLVRLAQSPEGNPDQLIEYASLPSLLPPPTPPPPPPPPPPFACVP